MKRKNLLPEPTRLSSWKEESDVLSRYVRMKAELLSELSILEAGCGSSWRLDMQGIQYVLMGVDIDQACLDLRVSQRRDLDIAIQGDLRTVSLAEGYYDVIYCSNVLEHIDGAQIVLNNFIRWLKSGGSLLLLIPNRDSAKGFITRVTPFWFHILFYRFVRGDRNAGKPGHAPFKTHFDEVVSRQGIYAYCEDHGLEIKAEYSAGHGRKVRLFFNTMSRLVNWFVHLSSFGKLSKAYADMINIIEKP